MAADTHTDATTKASPKPAWSDVLRDLQVLRGDLVKLGASALEAGEEAVAAEATSLKATVNALLGTVEEEGRSLVTSVETCVTKRPVASVALSFAAGLIAASLFTRRR